MAGTPGTFRFPEVNAKPSAPPAGYALLYIKTDNVLYLQDSTGLEIPLGTASGITSLTGEATGTGPGAAVVTLSNSAVIGKVLTGFSAGPNSPVVSSDTLLQAIQKLQAQVSASSGAAITGLNGDVSATGPGSVTATVNSVGGSSAANIHNAELAANAATASNTASTIVKRDASGNFAANIITSSLTGNVTGNVSGSALSFTGNLGGDVTGPQSATTISSPVVTGKLLTGYSVGPNTALAPTDSILTAFEKVQGQINAVSSTDVTAVTASSPLFSSGGVTPNITIQQANSFQSGYLSSVDWNTFNNKSSLIPIQQAVYVSSTGGNDSTGVPGDITKPFLTVSAAMLAVTDNSAAKRYTIFIMPGDYAENSLVLKPFISIKGSNYTNTRIRPGTNPITLDSSWTTQSQTRSQYEDVYFLGGPGLNLDFSTLGGTFGGTVEFVNCWCNGTFIVKGATGIASAVNIFNSNLLSSLSIQDMLGNCYLSAINVNGTTTLSAVNNAQSLNLIGSLFAGGIVINGTNSVIESSKIYSNGITSLTLNGANCTPSFSVTSLPTLASNVTITAGATYSLLDSSYGLSYLPSNTSYWPTVPTTVQQALDSLATSARIPTQTSHGGSILATDGTNLSWGQVQGYSTQSEFHVDSSYAGSIQNGNLNTPYITVQAAVNAIIANPTANAVIFVHGQGTTENVIINNYINGLSIQTFATTAKDSQVVKITGNLTLSGTTTRVRVKDIKIAYPSGTQPDLIDSSQGRNYFSNVDFGGGGGIQFTSSWARWHEFVDCTINGNVNMSGTPAAGSTVSMWRTRGAPTFGLNSSNVTLLLVDSENLGTITQTNGSMTVAGGFATGIISTANTPDTMTLVNVSLQNSGNTFYQINKTGTAPYSISNVWRNEAIDVLTGTRIVYGATAADQKYVPATPANWPTIPADTKDALDYLAAEASTGITSSQSIINALIFG